MKWDIKIIDRIGLRFQKYFQKYNDPDMHGELNGMVKTLDDLGIVWRFNIANSGDVESVTIEGRTYKV